MKDQQLPGIGLRSGNAALPPRMDEQSLVRFFSHRGFRFIRNRQGRRSAAFGIFKDEVDVDAFSRLRNADDERISQVELRFVECMDRWSRERYWNAGRHLEQIAAEKSGIVRAPARDQDYQTRTITIQI